MGICVLRRVAALGERLVLAPERYHPGRRVELVARRCLSDYVECVTETVSAKSWRSSSTLLILDTTHAYEGFVLCRHDPVAAHEMGSNKRQVQPGDVIVSRLRPYLRQVAVVDEALFRLAPRGNAVVVSTEFFVLRGRVGFEAAGLVPFLLSEPVQAALRAGQEGGHHPRFGRDLLLSLPVPEGVARSQRQTAQRIRGLAAALRRSSAAFRLLVAQVEAEMGGRAPPDTGM